VTLSRNHQIGGVVIIVLALWGVYAIRHISSDPVPAQVTAQDENASTDAPRTLRATRPQPDRTPDGPTELAAVIRPNKPAALSDYAAADVAGLEAPSANPNGSAAATPADDAPVATHHGTAGDAASLHAARAAIDDGDVIAARRSLSQIVRSAPFSPEADEARRELIRLADALLFSRATNLNDPLVVVHVVGSGETLETIAQRYQVCPELVARINEISDPNRIYAGTRLKLLRGPFRAEILKSQHRLDVYLGNILVRSYPVGLGADNTTPTGTWEVRGKLINPSWTDPTTNRHYLADDPDNPIGERWIGLHGIGGDALGRVGFGLHGTVDPSSIGEDMSMGCVRLGSRDVDEVYDLLTQGLSRVDIRP